MLVRHYERAGYDVLAVTEHWHRSDPPSSDRVLVLASAELNCRCRVTATGMCSRWASTTRSSARGRAARPRGNRRLDRRERRRRLPRAPVLDGRDPGNARAPRQRDRHRGLQRRLRARDRPRHLEVTGTSCSRRAHVLRPRDRRQPSSRFRLRPRVDLGAGRADTRRVLEALRTAASTRRTGRESHRSPPRTVQWRSNATPAGVSRSSTGSRVEPQCTQGGSATPTAVRSSRRTLTASSRPPGCPTGKRHLRPAPT